MIKPSRKAIPRSWRIAPKGFNIKLDFDQSVFVRAAIDSVLREALVSGCLSR